MGRKKKVKTTGQQQDVAVSLLDKLEAEDTEPYLDKRAGDSVIFCVIGFVCGMLTMLITFSIKYKWWSELLS